MATIKQVMSRMHSGHADMLAAIGANKPVCGPEARDGDLRGFRTMGATLSRWGAIDKSGISEFGVQVLAEWQRRHPTPEMVASNLLANHQGDVAATRKAISDLAYGNVSLSCRGFYSAADRVLASMEART